MASNNDYPMYLPSHDLDRWKSACPPIIRSFALTAALLFAIGCSDGGPPLADVTGRVTIDGRPFGLGKVMFAPAAQGDSMEAGKAAFGILEPDGSFRLSTFREHDGALVGSHAVTVIRMPAEDLGRPEDNGEFPPFTRMPYPNGKLTVEAGAENHFEIELSSAQIRQIAQKR